MNDLRYCAKCGSPLQVPPGPSMPLPKVSHPDYRYRCRRCDQELLAGIIHNIMNPPNDPITKIRYLIGTVIGRPNDGTFPAEQMEQFIADSEADCQRHIREREMMAAELNEGFREMWSDLSDVRLRSSRRNDRLSLGNAQR